MVRDPVCLLELDPRNAKLWVNANIPPVLSRLFTGGLVHE